MRRRWFFRVTSLTLLLLCLAGWGWSTRYSEIISYGSETRWRAVMLRPSGIVCASQTPPLGPPGWKHHHLVPNPAEDMRIFDSARRFLGFGWLRYNVGRNTDCRIPYWFPTLLLAALTWWTWRKRRNEGTRGFTVEGADQVREESGEKRAVNHH
jgi:hypothetical protein